MTRGEVHVRVLEGLEEWECDLEGDLVYEKEREAVCKMKWKWQWAEYVKLPTKAARVKMQAGEAQKPLEPTQSVRFLSWGLDLIYGFAFDGDHDIS